MVDVVESRPAAPTRDAGGRPKLHLRRVDGLDGLRVLGAVAVVVYHVMGAVLEANPKPTVIMPPIAFTFFIISGFVIYRPLAAAHMNRQRLPNPARFWTSRAIRVLPLWWFAVTVYLMVDGTDALNGPVDWIATYAIVQYAFPDVRYAVIGPAWALSVEWIFYLTVPLFAMALRGLNRRAFPRTDPLRIQLWALVPMLLVSAVLPPTRPFMAILVGMLLAVASIHQAQTHHTPEVVRVLRSSGFALGVTVVAWIVLIFYPYQEGLSVQWVEQDPIIVAIWILVATAWFGPVAFGRGQGILTRRLSNPWMVRLSLLTFGLYVWHDLVLRQVVERLGADVHLGAAMYLTLLGAVAVSAATFWAIERPLMKVRYRVVPPVPSARPVATQAERGNLQGDVELATEPEVDYEPSVAPTAEPEAAAAPTPTPPRTRPGTGMFRALDGVRVLAAAGIVAIHATVETTDSSDTITSIFSLFIPVFASFFVITGFVLYRPFLLAQARECFGDGQRPDGPVDGGVWHFYLRRAIRIYPLYWVVQAVALALTGTDGISTSDWVQLVTLVPYPSLAAITTHGLGVVVWTLIVDLGFYLVIPWIGRGATRTARATSFVTAQLVWVGGLFAVSAFIGSTSARVFGPVACLFVGMAIAAVDVWQRTHRRRLTPIRFMATALWLPPLAIVASWVGGITVAHGEAEDLLFTDHLGFHLLTMVVVGACLVVPAVMAPAGSPYRRLMSSPAAQVLGPLTFGIYLWHYPVIREVLDVADLPFAALYPLTLLLAAGLAVVTYRLVELPLDRLRHRIAGIDPGAR